MPSAKAVSVDMVMAQPCAEERPSVESEKAAMGITTPAQTDNDGKRDPASVSQLTHVEFPAYLEASNVKKQRHEPAVNPVAKIV